MSWSSPKSSIIQRLIIEIFLSHPRYPPPIPWRLSWNRLSDNQSTYHTNYLFTFSVLEVQALDHGVPSLSSSVRVKVDIDDANDNPPIYPEGNYTVYVQEDKPYGHILMRFSVTDSDDSPNGAPFTW